MWDDSQALLEPRLILANLHSLPTRKPGTFVLRRASTAAHAKRMFVGALLGRPSTADHRLWLVCFEGPSPLVVEC